MDKGVCLSPTIPEVTVNQDMETHGGAATGP